MYKVILLVTSNQLRVQNMVDHERFQVKHTMDFHKMFEENVYHQIHLKDQNRQSMTTTNAICIIVMIKE